MRDALMLLYWGFLEGIPPASPGVEECGDDETPDVLNCETLPDCT